MNQPKDYDSTLARIAGNILGHLVACEIHPVDDAVTQSVAYARAIVEEVKRTEPKRSVPPEPPVNTPVPR